MVTLKGPDREKLYENMTKDNLIPRAGTADEVAEGIMFVVKNKFVTGTTVDVDGGWLIS
jgi:NAD(P)-dependent dehydrogenase (short-subunit alcohol dehydrogenase family)